MNDPESNWLSVQVDDATMARIDVAKHKTNTKRADYVHNALMEALERDVPGGVTVTFQDIEKLLGILNGFKSQYADLGERLDAIEGKLDRAPAW